MFSVSAPTFRIPGLRPGATDAPLAAVTVPEILPWPPSVAPLLTSTLPVTVCPVKTRNVPPSRSIVPLPADELFQLTDPVSVRN